MGRRVSSSPSPPRDRSVGPRRVTSVTQTSFEHRGAPKSDGRGRGATSRPASPLRASPTASEPAHRNGFSTCCVDMLSNDDPDSAASLAQAGEGWLAGRGWSPGPWVPLGSSGRPLGAGGRDAGCCGGGQTCRGRRTSSSACSPRRRLLPLTPGHLHSNLGSLTSTSTRLPTTDGRTSGARLPQSPRRAPRPQPRRHPTTSSPGSRQRLPRSSRRARPETRGRRLWTRTQRRCAS